jgi:membrane protease subunit (stomatin/prohibitin family)
MHTLMIDTKKDGLLSGPGIPFYVEYPALRSGLNVTLHIEGTMTYGILDERLHAAADPAVLCSDVCSALAIAVSEAADQIGHPARVPEHAGELSASVRARLAKRWAEHYGADPGAIAITKVSLPPEEQAMMEKLDAAAQFAAKPPEEQRSAMAEKLRAAQRAAAGSIRLQTASWICTCGARNTGKFCTQCGKARAWVCACGAVNAGNFCTECGKPRT